MKVPAPNKTLTLPTGTHYSYIHYPSSNSNPTLVFLHGFPSTSRDWHNQITYFHSKGYGILAPDLLGYGESSKPRNPEAYQGKFMSGDIIAIMDHEGIGEKGQGRVIAIGHDWGTYLLSQLAILHPERFEKFVFFSVPHSPPGRAQNIAAINSSTRKSAGYEQFGYWMFFTEEGAGKVIGKHWESFFHLAYAADPSVWEAHFAPLGGMKSFITSNSSTALAPYITAEDKAHHHAAFGDDYSACLNWYRRGIANLGVDEEKELLKRGEIKSKMGKETLMITGLKDAVCTAERARISMTGTVEKGKLKVVDLDAGHWIMLERAEETNRALEEFFQGGVGGVKAVL